MASEIAEELLRHFLATKISFINAVAEVCEVADADVVDLATEMVGGKLPGRRRRRTRG